MKHIQESLEHYRDFKFFSLLEQNDKERKKLFRKNPKKEEDEKLAAQANRDVHEIIKKITENYKRMKSAGGGKIEVYKEFWDSQLKAKEALLKKDPGVKLVYNMYDSDYLVVGTVEAENAFVIVLKKDGAEGENPISKISSKEGYEAFKNVTLGVQKDLQTAKDAYVKNVENKKREEEERQRREKLDGFLKEEKINEQYHWFPDLEKLYLDFDVKEITTFEDSVKYGSPSWDISNRKHTRRYTGSYGHPEDDSKYFDMWASHGKIYFLFDKDTKKLVGSYYYDFDDGNKSMFITIDDKPLYNIKDFYKAIGKSTLDLREPPNISTPPEGYVPPHYFYDKF
jgi:hypothetical protein